MWKLVVIYVVAAFLLGFWPFEDGWLRTSSISPIQYTYDQGYEDGYYGELPKIMSGEYIDGYDEGEFYADCEWLTSENRRSEFERLRCGRWSDF